MKVRNFDFWRWGGTIDSGPYVVLGLLFFLLKYVLDTTVASVFFNREWTLTGYLLPGTSGSISALKDVDFKFYAALIAVALSFIWIGVGLTLRRLRAVQWPLWLVVFFFAPIVNLIFFTVLSLVPSAQGPGETGDVFPSHRFAELSKLGDQSPPRTPTNLDAFIPSGKFGSAFLGLLVTVVMGIAGTALSVHALGDYGWGLFVGLPFCLGLTSVLIYGYHEERTLGSCLLVALLAILMPAAALLIFAFEGLICLLMAAPLAIPLALLGGGVGYGLHLSRHKRNQTVRVLSGILIGLPGSMGMEHFEASKPPQLVVTSTIDIAAPPEKVWRKVVTFQQIPEPTEWLFRLGLAYPIKAEITGNGVGAVRHCVFSTGAFVEPIQVWDEPRLLKFSVTENPEPMHELSFYTDVHPPHLHGFLLSDNGQFLLTRLPDGGTRVEGTTWYHHGLWPAPYWQLWSDYIIHRIHMRVLTHIKAQAELKEE